MMSIYVSVRILIFEDEPLHYQICGVVTSLLGCASCKSRYIRLKMQLKLGRILGAIRQLYVRYKNTMLAQNHDYAQAMCRLGVQGIFTELEEARNIIPKECPSN